MRTVIDLDLFRPSLELTMSKTFPVPPAPPHNEGKTIAAWLLTAGTVLGFTVACLGLVFANTAVMIAGAAVIILAIAGSVALRAAGMGQKPKRV